MNAPDFPAPIPYELQQALARFSAGIDAIQAQHQAYLAATPSPLPERAGAPAQLRDFYLMLVGQAKVLLSIMDTLPPHIANQVRQLHEQELAGVATTSPVQ